MTTRLSWDALIGIYDRFNSRLDSNSNQHPIHFSFDSNANAMSAISRVNSTELSTQSYKVVLKMKMCVNLVILLKIIA